MKIEHQIFQQRPEIYPDRQTASSLWGQGREWISRFLLPEGWGNWGTNPLNRLKMQLLLSYLLVMETLLLMFGIGLYLFFSRDALGEIDRKLQVLAQYAASDLKQYFRESSQDNVGEVRALQGREQAFQDSSLSIEWFDSSKLLLDRHGQSFPALSPEVGIYSLASSDRPSIPLRSLTLRIQLERSQSLPPLEGYLRISQSLVGINQRAEHRLLMLIAAILGTFLLVTIGGIWLTQTATAPAEKMVLQLRQFTADASHELRSPLTAIQSSIDGMRNHPERFNSQDLQRVGIIARAAEQMTYLVKDLLFLARSDAQTEDYPDRDWDAIDINQLLREVEEWLSPVAKEKNIDLGFELEEAAWVRGDRAQLLRLFTNLIENAINYTLPRGCVSVALDTIKQRVRITVEDTGIGIAPEQLPHIFDRFWRSEQAREQRSQGTGLGLAISRAIVHSHQGKITVISQLRVGTCFTVYLPIQPPPLPL